MGKKWGVEKVQTKLNSLAGEQWQGLKKIIMFGYGRQGKKMHKTLSRDFDIMAIVDNSPQKQGKQVAGIAIKSFEEARPLMKEYKVIVTASQYYYKDIKQQLMEAGLTENIDFAMYQQFVTEWYYRYKGEINVLKTDISLTTYCTLNCEHCMQFLPYWENKKENSLEEIKDNLDIYFKCVDYLLDLDIVGGEPFLFSRLPEFIRYLGENYRHRIGYVGFITNGTIIPKDEVLDLLAQYSIEVSISDYSKDILYQNRVEELCKILEERNISYMRNQHIDWFDFGFPKQLYHFEGEAAVRHMQCCNSIEHVLDDGKLYYCGLEWAAQKSGLFPAEEKGYVDLRYIADCSVEAKREILELIMANIPDGYLEFCKVCGGFGIDNNNRVATAKQYRKKVD